MQSNSMISAPIPQPVSHFSSQELPAEAQQFLKEAQDAGEVCHSSYLRHCHSDNRRYVCLRSSYLTSTPSDSQDAMDDGDDDTGNRRRGRPRGSKTLNGI